MDSEEKISSFNECLNLAFRVKNIEKKPLSESEINILNKINSFSKDIKIFVVRKIITFEKVINLCLDEYLIA